MRETKMRETWSADAITREISTEFDHAMIPLTDLYKGVTSRKTTEEVLSIFDKMCKYTVSNELNFKVNRVFIENEKISRRNVCD